VLAKLNEENKEVNESDSAPAIVPEKL